MSTVIYVSQGQRDGSDVFCHLNGQVLPFLVLQKLNKQKSQEQKVANFQKYISLVMKSCRMRLCSHEKCASCCEYSSEYQKMQRGL